MRFARTAIDHRIGESLDVSGGLENLTMHEDGTVHTDDVVALVHGHAPPVVLQVAL